MNFELSKEQKAIQKAAWDFANRDFTKELALECELAHKNPDNLRRKAGELGFIGMQFPEEYGGQGYGAIEEVLVTEALCRKDPGLGLAIASSGFGSEFIVRFGTEQQKKAFLPGIATGEILTGAAFTEPNHGSDVTDIDTTAIRDGDEYVINGVKTFITNGLDGQLVMVLCKTDPGAAPPHRGMSIILVETNRDGYDATDVGPKMGLKMSCTAEIAFKNVRVPVANLIGEENKGFYHSLEVFNRSRLSVAAICVGGAQAAMDRAISYAKQREQFGRPIAKFQVIQHKLAEMAIKTETARLLTYKAAWVIDNKEVEPVITSMAKVYAARIAIEVAEEAIQIFGGYGYLVENEVERIYRDMRVMELFEGTREIQKNTIGQHLVGKS